MSEVSMVEDILSPLVRHLRTTPEIESLQNLYPEQSPNPVLGPPVQTPQGTATQESAFPIWVFRGFQQNGSPYVSVEGTGTCAITLEHAGSWARRNRGNHLYFPEVRVYYHCDPTRDLSIGAPIRYDARDKCLTIHRQVLRALHVQNPGPSFMNWGPRDDGTGFLRVVTSYSGRDLVMNEIPQGDGAVEGVATFEMEVLL